MALLAKNPPQMGSSSIHGIQVGVKRPLLEDWWPDCRQLSFSTSDTTYSHFWEVILFLLSCTINQKSMIDAECIRSSFSNYGWIIFHFSSLWISQFLFWFKVSFWRLMWTWNMESEKLSRCMAKHVTLWLYTLLTHRVIIMVIILTIWYSKRENCCAHDDWSRN